MSVAQQGLEPLKSRSLVWQLGLSAYWFAVSMKWFVLLLTLGFVVERLVPGGDKGTLWGRVVMIGAAWAMVGPALFGFLSDRTTSRFGRWRPYLAMGSALTVVALVILFNASSYWVVVVGYLLLQISDDLATGPYSSLIPGLVPESQRGRASGVMALLQFSAQIVGGITALILGEVAAIFVAVAIANVLCASITILTVREDPIVGEPRRATFAESWIAPWRQNDFRWAWFTRFLNALGFYLVITYLSYYLVDAVKTYRVFGFTVAGADADTTPEQAAQKAVFVLALLISLMAAVGGVVGGRLSDRLGRKRVIYVAGTAMAVLLPPFALFPNFTLIALLAIGFGLAYGAYESSGWALVSDVMPSKSELAKDMGLWQSSISAPQILSGLAGMAVDWGNRAAPGRGYTFTFLFAALAYLLSTVLVRKIRGST